MTGASGAKDLAMHITTNCNPVTVPQAANDNLEPNQPLRLADAVRLCFPEGGMTKNGLMREARKGRLVIEKIANKIFTTPSAIEEMRKLCRVKIEDRVYGGEETDGKVERPLPKGRGFLSTNAGITPRDALIARIEGRRTNS
jgi:hypothetical protein